MVAPIGGFAQVCAVSCRPWLKLSVTPRVPVCGWTLGFLPRASVIWPRVFALFLAFAKAVCSSPLPGFSPVPTWLSAPHTLPPGKSLLPGDLGAASPLSFSGPAGRLLLGVGEVLWLPPFHAAHGGPASPPAPSLGYGAISWEEPAEPGRGRLGLEARGPLLERATQEEPLFLLPRSEVPVGVTPAPTHRGLEDEGAYGGRRGRTRSRRGAHSSVLRAQRAQAQPRAPTSASAIGGKFLHLAAIGRLGRCPAPRAAGRRGLGACRGIGAPGHRRPLLGGPLQLGQQVRRRLPVPLRRPGVREPGGRARRWLWGRVGARGLRRRRTRAAASAPPALPCAQRPDPGAGQRAAAVRGPFRGRGSGAVPGRGAAPDPSGPLPPGHAAPRRQPRGLLPLSKCARAGVQDCLRTPSGLVLMVRDGGGGDAPSSALDRGRN